MAERLGFEPRKELPLCRFSRPVLSTTQPSLREQGFISIILKFNKKTEHFFFKILPSVQVLYKLSYIILYERLSFKRIKSLRQRS